MPILQLVGSVICRRGRAHEDQVQREYRAADAVDVAWEVCRSNGIRVEWEGLVEERHRDIWDPSRRQDVVQVKERKCGIGGRDWIDIHTDCCGHRHSGRRHRSLRDA